MWCGMCLHAYLHARRPAVAGTLRAVDAGDAMLVHQLAPATISKDHQLCNDFVERRTALASRDGDDLVFNIKIEINPIRLLRLETKTLALDHAPLLQHLGPLPQLGDIFFVRIVTASGSKTLERDEFIEIVVTQVGSNRDRLGHGVGRQHRPVAGVERDIQRERGARGTGGQREAFDERIRQHGNFVAGHIHGAHARTR